MDLADALRQLKPDVARKGVGPEGRGVSVEDRSPFVWDPGMLASAAGPADDSGCTRALLVRGRYEHTRRYPETC
jgi:hypothetical protein